MPTPAATMKPSLAKLPSSNLVTADEISARIYDAVVDNRLAPGTKLREQPLAELFGVTRGTIRKAFSQLADRKVVDLTPNRGASVASPSLEECRDLFDARRTIECAIVERLAATITRSQVRELNALVKQEARAYELGDRRAALQLSIDLHRVLASMAGNAVLVELLDRLVTRTPVVVLAFRDSAKPATCANRDHHDLVAAIAAHDADSAMTIMKCHLCNLEGQLGLRTSAPKNELAAIFGINATVGSMQ